MDFSEMVVCMVSYSARGPMKVVAAQQFERRTALAAVTLLFAVSLHACTRISWTGSYIYLEENELTIVRNPESRRDTRDNTECLARRMFM